MSPSAASLTGDEDVRPDLIEFGSRAVEVLADMPNDVRVDVVSDGDGHLLMEVELNEPALGLHLDPGAAGRFADALSGCISSGGAPPQGP